MAAPDLDAAVTRSLARIGVAAGDRILVAFSGGPDSSALLIALVCARPGTVGAAYLDHGLQRRGARGREYRAVRRLATALGCPLYTGSVAAGHLATGSGRAGGIEAAARQVRYRWLRRTARGQDYRWIATGHTRDDQVETVLMRLLAGGGLAAARGIPLRRGPIIRPLLGVNRRDVIVYLKRQRIVPFRDAGNRDGRYLRNRIRAVLTTAEATVPGVRAGLLRVAADAAAYRRMVAAAAQQVPVSMANDASGPRVSCPVYALVMTAEPVRERTFLEMAARLRRAQRDAGQTADHPIGRVRRLPRRFLAPFVRAPAEPNRRDGHGLTVTADGATVTVQARVVPAGESGYLMVARLGDGREAAPREATLREATLREAAYKIPGVDVWVCIATAPRTGSRVLDIVEPLVVRTRRPGDSVRSTRGRVPLKKLFNEWRVPVPQRQRVPILEDRLGIVAVLGEVFGAPTVQRVADFAGEGEVRRVAVWCSPGTMSRPGAASAPPVTSATVAHRGAEEP